MITGGSEGVDLKEPDTREIPAYSGDVTTIENGQVFVRADGFVQVLKDQPDLADDEPGELEDENTDSDDEEEEDESEYGMTEKQKKRSERKVKPETKGRKKKGEKKFNDDKNSNADETKTKLETTENKKVKSKTAKKQGKDNVEKNEPLESNKKGSGKLKRPLNEPKGQPETVHIKKVKQGESTGIKEKVKEKVSKKGKKARKV